MHILGYHSVLPLWRNRKKEIKRQKTWLSNLVGENLLG